MTLVEFLLARIAEDEQRARDRGADAMMGSRWKRYPEEAYNELQAVALASSRRTLAECEANRQIVEECRALINSFGDWDAEPGAVTMWSDVNRRERSQAHGRLATLAAIYADHPDYLDEWRP